MTLGKSFLGTRDGLCLAAALLAAGCSTSAASRKAEATPSPAAATIAAATADFEAGRDAALAGDFACAQDAFGRALDTVRPAGSPPSTDPELIAFCEDLYDGILRYEALAAPPEDAGSTQGHLAPELEKIEASAASEEAISNAWTAVASDATASTFDVPIVVNESVLRILATFQNDFHAVIANGLARSGRFVPMIRQVFQEEGIPRDLAQVAMIESSFLPHARSPMAARGLWQFMPRTGRHYGLRTNGVIDERADPEKATRAAARYLSYLHELFHDWYLAMAAYNAGEGKILRAMERTGLADFWQLAASGSLRMQTQNYVPAVIAAILISKNPAHYGFDVDYEKPLEYETVTLDRPVRLSDLAGGETVTLEALRALNPELRTNITPRASEGYELKVPTGRRESVLGAFADAPTARPPALRRHVVRAGETVASIAARFGVSPARLAAANGLPERAKLKKGRVVLIPGREVVRVASQPRKKGHAQKQLVAAAQEPARPQSYRVRGGDTLYRIAIRHRTTVAELLAVNTLSEGSLIRPGDRLRIPSKSR
ncbi:MAG: transglycosylase SLT domain-containing protein [Thermoanaerobaculia bacterium]